MKIECPEQELDRLVDHLFRRQSGRLVAALTRALGSGRLALAEEAVQEALLQALRRWPFSGVPSDPAAWLLRVARNRAIDVLRRESTLAAKRPDITSLAEARLQRLPEARFAAEIDDESLRMMFVCCHPSLPADSRVALTLQVVGGFSHLEIARAFLVRPDTVSQRLSRAKRRIVDLELSLAMPAPDELEARLESVRAALYLMFTEGHWPASQDAVVRRDICEEGVRLAELLAEHPGVGCAESHALAALLLLHGARLDTRCDDQGALILLADQDRGRWRPDWLRRGFRHLEAAMGPGAVSPYHLEAGIAASHAAAPTWEKTDWGQIVGYYDRLCALYPSPARLLNRAVAVAELRGAGQGLEEILRLLDDGRLEAGEQAATVEGELRRRIGDRAGARRCFQRALEATASEPRRRLLGVRIDQL